MKSVMQEASSIAKAFEQAWEKAGKPQQCSVKVLEEPRHNFIGMTLQSAKIALFFDDLETRNFTEKMTGAGQTPSVGNAGRAPKPQQSNKPQQAAPSQRNVAQAQSQSVISQRNAGQAPRNDEQSKDVQKPATPRPDYWSEEMI